MSDLKMISPATLKQLHDSDPRIAVIDVRTQVEYNEVHTSFAELAPLESFDAEGLSQQFNLRRVDAVYVLCKSGKRARVAGERLASNDVPNVHVVDGGILAWEAAGLPVVRGE